MKKDKKFIILAVLFAISLGFNVYFLSKITNTNYIKSDKVIERYLLEDPEKEDYTLIKNTLEKFAKDENHLVLTNSGKDVTDEYEDKLFEFYKNKDYKGAKEYVLKEGISIAYSEETVN
ncbi:MAG: hypothetical protein SPI59_06065 [Finegoldia sp.]|nr:hypothetical protein [Finegoldia sp.]